MNRARLEELAAKWEASTKAALYFAANELRAILAEPEPKMEPERQMYVLAMAVLQSDVWASADDELREAVEFAVHDLRGSEK